VADQDIAGQILKGAQRSIEQTGTGVASAVGQIGQAMFKAQENRRKHDAAKEALAVKKTESLSSAYVTGLTKIPAGKARTAYFKGVITPMSDQFGLAVSPAVQELFTASPETAQAAAIAFGNYINDPNKTPEKISAFVEAMNDPEKAMELMQEAATVDAKVSSSLANLGISRERLEESKKRQQFAVQKDVRQRSRDLSKELVNKGIPAIQTTFASLNKIIPGGIEKFTGKKNIPGIGGPEALLPTGQLSAEGRQVRQLALDLGNQIIKLQTGAAMNKEEAVRIMGALGLDQAICEGGGFTAVFRGTKSDQDFINGLKNAQAKINSITKTLESGFGADAVALLNKERTTTKQQVAFLSGVKRLKAAGKTDAQIKTFLKGKGQTDEQIQQLLGK